MKKVLAAVLFLVIIFFNVVILKPTAQGSNDKQLTVPDLTFTYDGQTIYDNFFLQLAPETIPAYKKMMRWDYVYPLVYAAFLLLMGQLLFRNKLYKRVFITAVIAAFLFDYAENLTQRFLLNELPRTHYGLGSIMGLFTTMKWTTALFALFSVITALVRAGIRKFIRAKEQDGGQY